MKLLSTDRRVKYKVNESIIKSNDELILPIEQEKTNETNGGIFK
jgi:hypothetical protein